MAKSFDDLESLLIEFGEECSMSTQKVFKESVVNSLRERVKTDVSSYQLDEPWVEKLFPDRSLFATTKLAELPDDLLLMPEGDEKFDLENSERLYSALHGLTLTQAADPRLWTYLTHVKYWKYMRKRWPIKDDAEIEKKKGSIVSRYFLVYASGQHTLNRPVF